MALLTTIIEKIARSSAYSAAERVWKGQTPAAANWRSPARTDAGARLRLAPALAALVFALVLGFYLYTLQPSLAWGDGAKLQIEAITGQSFILADLPADLFGGDRLPFARLGVAAWDHPLYVMLGHTLVRSLPGLDPAWLVNTISAFFGAGSLAVFFLLCLSFTQSPAAAALAALGVAVSHTFWFHAATPEVYTLFAFLLLLSIYLYNQFETTGRYPALFASVLALGLGMSNHILAALALPAILAYRFIQHEARPVRTLSPLKFAGLGLAFLAGFLPFLVQLARMLRVFPLAEVFGPVVGSVFLRELVSLTPGLLLESVLTYLTFLAVQFNPLALLIGGYGLLFGRQAAGPAWLKGLVFYGVYTLFGIFYRVTDQFAFFLASHLFFGIMVAAGLAHLLARLPAARRAGLLTLLGLFTLSMPPLYGLAPSSAPALGFTDKTLGIPQIGTDIRDGFAYYANPNKRGDTGAYDFGASFFSSAPPNTLVIAEWYTDTDEFFVLGYFSRVEALRPDIEIIGWPMDDPFDFDTGLAVALIEAEVGRRPVYLASLSDDFYGAAALASRYCLTPELNLYRVYLPTSAAQLPAGATCLAGAGP